MEELSWIQRTNKTNRSHTPKVHFFKFCDFDWLPGSRPSLLPR